MIKELKFLKGNRTIDKKHVDSLVKLIKKNGYMEGFPIIVTKDDYIVDGQHRYLACQSLGVTPTITKISLKSTQIKNEVIEVNQSQKKWSLDDYIHAFCDKGNPNYIELRRLSNFYNLKPYVMASVVLKGTYGGDTTRLLRSENFAFDYSAKGLAKIDDKVKAIERIIRATGLPRRSRLIAVLSKLYDTKGFLADTLISKCSFQRDRIYQCSTVSGYLRMFEDIYNYKSRKPVKFS